MCCLFGFIDYGHYLTHKQKEALTTALAVASEARGTDATGIAYGGLRTVHVFKRPLPAHCMQFYLPAYVNTLMGHTRLATQGSHTNNRNNHPFTGKAGKAKFALAHNGVIHNDLSLKLKHNLPTSAIETDSYVIVALLEKLERLSIESLVTVSEELRGTFTYTLLDEMNRLYIVKGNNPFCLYHYPELGLYVYASTKEILEKALMQIPVHWGHLEEVRVMMGDIIRIDSKGTIKRGHFDTANIEATVRTPMFAWEEWFAKDTAYLDELKEICGAFGYSHEEIDALADAGFSPEEIEEYFYCSYFP